MEDWLGSGRPREPQSLHLSIKLHCISIYQINNAGIKGELYFVHIFRYVIYKKT